jgi:dTDP-4-dehydrorhamnose reductase
VNTPSSRIFDVNREIEPRYLIIGASGFVGTHLYAALGPANAVATSRTRPAADRVPFNAVTMRLADAVLKQHRGLTHAFILHGITGIDACASHPEETARINVESTRRIIDDLVAHGIVPVFASSDAVFDGSRGMWVEDDPVNPILTYGRQKAEVERYLATQRSPSLVVRLAKVVAGAPAAGGLINEWFDQLERAGDMRCASDQFFSPVEIEDVVRALIRLAEGAFTGVFHVCGPQRLSRLEFLQLAAAEAGRYRTLRARIVPCSIRDFEFAEPRPLDASMSPRKLYHALGCSFEAMNATCARAAARRYARAAPAALDAASIRH